jgi:hydroxyacylglutathione hydrolase
MFQRFTDEGLAQSSYLIACDRTRQAVVVDPRRDVDAYVEATRRHGLTLAVAIETHTHADFVSGARELAAFGARVVAGPGSDLQFPFHETSHGAVFHAGDIALEVLHTPGHTPEHISIVVREPGHPARVLTGDTLFVGAVGRPDLLGADQARGLAEDLYDSLVDRLLTLPDDVEVHPGHGAGSLCGSGIGKEAHSTIGQERRFNPLLQQSKSDFVQAVLNDLPETPPYFPRMKVINRQGPAVLGLTSGVTAPALVAPRDAAALIDRGALVIDMRDAEAFGAGHPTGAINLGFGARIGYWAGWIVPADTDVVLLAGTMQQATEARRQLLRVGLDAVGAIDGGFAAWQAGGGALSRLEQITARELRARRDREPLTLVDVRTPREWRAGHVDGSLNVPVGELQTRATELRGAGPLAAICESGYRSSLASSLLLRAGFAVVNVTDGTSAYRALAEV